MPDRRGRCLLYSDTSKHATGSALYQGQDDKPKLIAYMSKRIPEAARNYSITELEMCGLAINITSFAHLLKRVDTIVDHLSIMYIMKSKMEPTTNRIKRLLELLSSYSFKLYYVKGKDMVLSDFLLRQQVDDSDLHEIIPISFNMRETLKQKYYKVEEDKFLVQTRSQTKASGIQLPAIHGVTKLWFLMKDQKDSHQVSVGLGLGKVEQQSEEKQGQCAKRHLNQWRQDL